MANKRIDSLGRGLWRFGVSLGVSAFDVLAIGCSTSTQYVPTVNHDQFRISELHRSSYSVNGDAEATACRKLVAFWPIPIWVVWGENGTSMFGWPFSADVDAQQKALAATPGADAILQPRVKVDHETYLWYAKVCVTMRGKAVRIRTDEEVAKNSSSSPSAAAAQAPSAPDVPAALAPPPPRVGCGSDADCKAGRVCQRGACVAP